MSHHRRITPANAVLALSVTLSLGACGQLIGANDYEIVDPRDGGTGGALAGGAAGALATGATGGLPGTGGATGGSAGALASGGAPTGGVGGATGGGEQGGAAGDAPTGGSGGTTGGTGGVTGGSGGVTGGSGGVTGGTGGSGGSGGTTGGSGGTTGGSGGATGGSGGSGGTTGGSGGATGGSGGVTGGTGGTGGTVPCDPRDPEPGCGLNRRCEPQPTGDPICRPNVGTQGDFVYCVTDADCLPTHFCFPPWNDNPSNDPLNVCLPWCRVGRSDCGAGLACYGLAGDDRFIGTQEWGLCAPPGDIPPPAWTCYDSWYWDHDTANGGCDCGCGAPDPDCFGDTTAAACDYCSNDFQDTRAYDPNGSCSLLSDTCDDIQALDNTLCNRCATSPCLGPSTSPPAAWTCAAGDWLDGLCDCGCGAYDPECPAPTGLTGCLCWNDSCGNTTVGSTVCTGIDPTNNSQCSD